MKEDVPAMVEYYILRAKMQHEAYKAYVSEGFTKEQALELVKGI